MGRQPAGDRQDRRVGGQVTGDDPLAVDVRRRQAAGNVSQSDVGDRGVQHLHERGDDDRDGDEPGIDRRAAAAVGVRATLLMRGLLNSSRQNDHRSLSDRATVIPHGSPEPSGFLGHSVCKASGEADTVGRLRKLAKRLQDLSGVRPGGRFLEVDVGDDREADEQGALLGVVVRQLDPDRQTLDDLHEVAGGVLRRQQGQGLTGPHREAGDAALELSRLPYMSTSQRTRWPMRRSASCVSLKLASIQISRERADGHQALPHGDVVAGVDVAAGDHAVDLADDVAVAEVQLGLGEVALGLPCAWRRPDGPPELRARSAP